MNKLSLQCIKCGEKISPGVKFCGFCGTKIDDHAQERNIPDYDNDSEFNSESPTKQSTMNPKQKLIFSVTVPLVIIICALGIASNAGGYGRGPFSWDRTWLIWAIALAAIGKFEYWLSNK